MKIQKKYVIVFFAGLSFLFTASAENKSFSSKAADEAHSARLSAIGASGAAQVSQVHDQAQTGIQVLLVEQLDKVLKRLEAPNPEDSATSKSLEETRYILYGILAIGIILIFQLSLISSKLRNKQAEQDSGGNA